jgi:nitroreductase
VKNPETKKELAKAALDQGFVARSPVVIVVCSDLYAASDAYGQRGSGLYSIQNTAAAIENMLLAAWSRGLGSCWVGAFNEERVKDSLVLPTNIRPLAIITLGYPLRIPAKPRRRNLKDVVHAERW